MKNFKMSPEVCVCSSCDDFSEKFMPGKGDLVFVEEVFFDSFKNKYTGEEACVVNFGKYPKGEPTDILVETIYGDVCDYEYSRVFAVGGGTILDVAKLFALKNIVPVVDLFQRKLPVIRDKRLILVPTTCGTGSEMTNISILELTSIHSKFGLAADELYADTAVLIPDLIENLPQRFFAASSIDALIHAVESFTSPKANSYTRMFSVQAMTMILEGYKKIAKDGEAARKALKEDFMIASNYAGIAFGNAGCAAVHAMSYPLGAAYHVPHGESNYAIFTGVYKKYMSIDPDGSIKELNAILAEILECDIKDVYEEIEVLLNKLLQKKALHEYGVKKSELKDFTEVVMTKQQRLTANNYVPLSEKDIMDIYISLY